MFVTIQCIWCVHFLIFEGVLSMKVQRYSVKMFGEIPLPQVRRFSLKVFLLVMVSCLKISLMENDHVDVDIGQKIYPSRFLRFFRVEFCPTSALASNIYTLLTSGPAPQVPFFQVHTAITYVITNHTHTRYIFFIYGIQMSSQHLKPACINGNTISKFIPQHHHNRNTSAFC